MRHKSVLTPSRSGRFTVVCIAVTLLVAGVLALAPRAVPGDELIDNFEDSNFTAEGWDGAVWTGLDGGGNPVGQGTATRVNANDILAISSKTAQLISGNGGTAFEFSDAILASDATLEQYRA